MHFLIWIPDEPGSPLRKLEHVGLGDLAPGAMYEQLPDGPSGTQGHLVSWRTPGQRFAQYDEGAQTWQPAAAVEESERGRYWIGWRTDQPPTPDDLLIRYPFNGPTVKLGDGRYWQLPAPDRLPWDVVLADDGDYRFEPQRRFAHFIVLCRQWQARMDDPDERDNILVSELAQFVEAALRINYRMPRELPSILRLFSSGGGGTLDAALQLLVRVEP